MNLSTDEIAKLFNVYMPGYECTAERMRDDSIALQFRNIANDETFTIPGFSALELASAPIIKRVAKVMFEELAVASAARARTHARKLH